MDMNQLIALLIGQGQQWILAQRNSFRPRGRVLPDTAVAELAPFFEERLLQEVRLVTVPALKNPEFLEAYGPVLAEKAIPSLDFRDMAGITFVDTILLVDRFLAESATSLIFHELVHAVQYELVGPEKFVELYILGWVNQGFNYAAIPLEMDAYELQNRYEAEPAEPFSVREEVSRRLELLLDD